jgi:glycosyltransferase involved in cell wall biosynthesis
MATGAPLVTTRVGQAQEIVETGRNGLVVDVEDVEALADAVVRVHDDEELRRVLVIEGRATAERYANERLDRQWAELLEGFVSRTAA